MNTLALIATGVLSYLLGSVSTGILVAKITGQADPRTVGSKSAGATNALRTMGTKYGVIVLLGDALKALAACLIGWFLVDRGLAGQSLPPYGRMLAAVCVIVGHVWPCFFQFKGGKGVACIMGSMLTCFPVPAFICILIGLGVVFVTRYVSLGSITGVALYALLSIFWFSKGYASGNLIVILFACAVAALCILKHSANIKRLLHGEENKFGSKKK